MRQQHYLTHDTCLLLSFELQLIGREGPQVGTFFPFVLVTRHVLNTRSITWMVSMLVPTIAVIWDVTGKVYSNMFFPTQTQVHAERAYWIEKERWDKRTYRK